MSILANILKFGRPAGPGVAGGPPAHRRGMTFTEVMFAVILLGIGFLLVAGMFPVAIQQTQATLGDAAGANLAPAAMRYMEQVADERLFPAADDLVHPLPGPTWELVRGNLILESDPRFAWVPLYRRIFTREQVGNVTYPPRPLKLVQLIFIAVECRTRPAFRVVNDPADLTKISDVLPDANRQRPPNLYPRMVRVTLIDGGNDNPDIAEFARPEDAAPVADGAFLVTPDARIYRFAGQVESSSPLRWYLAAGYDINSGELYPPNTPAFVVGRSYEDNPQNAQSQFGGPAMDIAAYTTFMTLK